MRRLDDFERGAFATVVVAGWFVVLAIAACVEPYDLVGPDEPGYAELCELYAAPGDTLQLRREMFERCDPGPRLIIVIIR